MLIRSKMQQKLRTYEIEPNNNISFPIGTILAVEKFYDDLDFFSTVSVNTNNVELTSTNY